MLIEFSVENHRAIREKQTFLMVAGEDTERTRVRRVIRTKFAYSPRVLKSACIVGPNGAGKTSLVDAMHIMGRLARRIRRDRDDDSAFAVEPFAFHSKWSDKPSEFEVVFIQGKTLYQYGFSVTRSQVIDEWLFASDSGKANQRTVFTRTYNKKTRGYKWYIKGVKSEARKEFWKSATKHSSLFLSLANEFNVTKDIEMARIWISQKFITRQTLGAFLPSTGTARLLNKDKKWKDKVLKFLQQSGISVEDIQVEDTKKDAYAESYVRRRSVSFIRRNDLNQEIPLEIQKESKGTNDLFALAYPILVALESGNTLVVDELNLGLHPLALERLISMFHSPVINRKNAQLIFTTHDLASIEHARVDYDQIWLVRKNDELAARLYPLSDYEITKGRKFMDGYLQGLYGAIPRISRVEQ